MLYFTILGSLWSICNSINALEYLYINQVIKEFYQFEIIKKVLLYIIDFIIIIIYTDIFIPIKLCCSAGASTCHQTRYI